MKPQRVYDYICLGLFIRTMHTKSGLATKANAMECVNVINRLLKDLNFPVSMAMIAGHKANNALKELYALPDDQTTIGASLAERLRPIFSDLENVIFAESSIRKVYVLSDSRFNADYLSTSPEKLFKESTFLKLEDIAVYDIKAACRCILFSEATAAAFHILRATESALKSYYFHHRRQNRLATPMWGPMVSQLRAKKSKRPPESLLNALDNIRHSYRNPTQHPEAVYDIQAVQDLFGICLDVIGRMAEELPSLI